LARKTTKKKAKEEPEEAKEEASTEPEVLKPKRPATQAPQGIRTFTIARQYDETGVSGIGVVIEGVVLATGQAIIHWLTPAPRGALAIFDSMDDFIKIHIKPHPGNASILTWDDGEQEHFGNVSSDP
jgi:hypothetical protein|tara:strand:- start:584 stop:964 length:381 start_codon:yes stop_codon:yes gene_type:complete